MLNYSIMMGRLTADPELRHTANDIATTSFRIAVQRDFKTADSKEAESDFFTIVAWRKTAEFICNYFSKGSFIAVESRPQVRKYTDKEGVERTVTEFVAERVHFAGSKTNTEPQGKAAPPVSKNQLDDGCGAFPDLD